jgi:hypothetical protein
MGIAFWSAFSSTLLWTFELMIKLGTRWWEVRIGARGDW